MSDNIKVVVKVRPLISREIEDKLSYQWRVKSNTLYQLDSSGKEAGSQYTFDQVYDETTKTEDVYKDVAKPIVEAAIAGFNGTIFAYGQTSSGKTYTMSGTDNSPGIIQLSVLNLFEQIKCIPKRDFLVRVSYIEIYNETLKDLLDGQNDKIRIQETLHGMRVTATEKFTSSPEEVMEIMREGEVNRQMGATNMNEESSRSHSIFQITVESREHAEGEDVSGSVNVSTLNLVDLAGSERSGQTGATGKRFKEGTHINKSLSVLALVIKQLSEDPNKHANYRDSKLTRLLQNSLGGNAKTSIICAVTPAAVEETISTLQFANRAKAIKNKPEVNAVHTDKTKLQDLTKQLSELQSELAMKNHIEQDNQILMKKIRNLQKMILNGLGQRTADAGGCRRKTWCAPRRATISALPALQEEAETSVRRFCTPGLKYNPLLPHSDFQPVQRPSQLAPVSEEPILKTPPNDKKVNFTDEIIDLDSDEDNTSNTSRCSPYHKCYSASKTPPCVLRKNFKMAEKNLKDIEEFTQREKIFEPQVLEYMEKFEQSTSKITKLEDEIKALGAQNLEKESEVKQLLDKITQTENKVQQVSSAKAELEAKCNEFNTKVTDLEVSYETLKMKSKLREDELLSLLNEQTNTKKRTERISGKGLSRTLDKEFSNFMDLSKDISLVSDNDSSVDTSNTGDMGESSAQLQDLVDEMKTQIAAKNEAILNLENDLSQQKLTIISLERTCKELREQVTKSSNTLEYVNQENTLLKSSIETLNSTISSQRQNLETATNDMQSYNTTIQELQMKLKVKKCNCDLNISDNLLEDLIAQEEKIIANNENLKNIIQCFKTALDTKIKKIESLESSLESKTSEHDFLIELVQTKDEQITCLIGKVKESQMQFHKNQTIIEELMMKCEDLIKSEHVLSDKLLIAEQQNVGLEKKYLILQKVNNQLKDQSKEFDHKYAETVKNLNDFKNNLCEIQAENEELRKLQTEVVTKNNLIDELRSQVLSRDDLITSLKSEHTKSQDKFKSIVSKLQQLLSVLTGDVCNQTEIIDDSVVLFTMLYERLNDVEVKAKEVVLQKELAVINNNELKQELEVLQNKVRSTAEEKNKAEFDNDTLNQRINQLTNELNKVQIELTDLNIVKSNLHLELQKANESIQKLSDDVATKGSEIIHLHNEEGNLRLEVEEMVKERQRLQIEVENLQLLIDTKQAKYENLLQTKEKEIMELKQNSANTDLMLDENGIDLKRLCKTLNETVHIRNQVLGNIEKAASNLMVNLEIQHDGIALASSDNYSNIVLILEIATDMLLKLKSEKLINDNSKELKEKEEKQILNQLQEQLEQTLEKLSCYEEENDILIDETDKIKESNKKLSEDLLKCREMLQELEDDVKEKLRIIETLEVQINEWKCNFAELEVSMKQQILDLQQSNYELQSQISQKNSYETYSIHDRELSDVESCPKQAFRKSLSDILVEPENASPQSLLTLCCNKILEVIQPSETDLKTPTSSSLNIHLETASMGTQTNTCDCDKLLEEKDIILTENFDLKTRLDFVQFVNFNLLKEQEEVRKEVKLLLEPAQELQRKISNHRTNLSTLTATTNAENKLLKSQVKVLQHHNNRFFSVCQRDLPAFKKLLQELSTILKSTPLANRLEANIKRYSLPEVLERNSSASNFKDESTLDGDILMLDTNVTLASADNTILAQDQTCLDGTQIYLDTDLNTDLIQTIDPNVLHTQLEILMVENRKMTIKIENLKDENCRLHEKIDYFTANAQPDIRKIDAQSSPIKLDNSLSECSIYNDAQVTVNLCDYCKNENTPETHGSMAVEIQLLKKELLEVRDQNVDLKKSYNDISADIIANDKLVLRISALEKDYKAKICEINQLNQKLSIQSDKLNQLQEENDTLSTQVMESIDESESLRKELDIMKKTNSTLTVNDTEQELVKTANAQPTTTITCLKCASNASVNPAIHSSLNRSRSDSESSSRFNKLSTLQNELQASKEDCKSISQDVVTIKNHLGRGNLSIPLNLDLDDSMGESNIFPGSTETGPASPKKNATANSDVPEKQRLDIYDLDKLDCFNYYVEKTGAEHHFNQETKIIDMMKMFYNNLLVKHGNEVENLVNKLKDFEESRNQLHEKIDNITSEYSKINEEILDKNNRIISIANVVCKVKENITILDCKMCASVVDKNAVVEMFKDTVLRIFDTEFQLPSVCIFEKLIDKVVNNYQKDLVELMNRYSELQSNMRGLTSELSDVTNSLNQMKYQLSENEKEYNLLKAQKERLHEITNAVTLDIVKKDQELSDTINKGFHSLQEYNVFTQKIDLSLSVNQNISLLIEKLIQLAKQNDLAFQEKHNLLLEQTRSKTVLAEKDSELESQNSQLEQLRELCKNATNELQIKTSLHAQLTEVYEKKVDENSANIIIIENLTQEILVLKEKLDSCKNESDDSETKTKIAELMESVNSLEHENKQLKSVNKMLTSESEQNALLLAKADDTIKNSKTELEKMTAEILSLNLSMKENLSVIESLKLEAKNLMEHNFGLKQQFEEINEVCSRLKLNMKTHEKTAEIQCKILNRLKKEKEESDSLANEIKKEVEELKKESESLNKEREKLTEDVDKYRRDADEMKEAKELLERRVSELEKQTDLVKVRTSLGVGDSRRRRQSLLDSKRTFCEDKEPDHKKMEAYFSPCTKPDDMFTDVDDHSNRSTPNRTRRSDSYQSRNDEQSDREESGSRPGSALARRRRRQSLHDQHRNTARHPDQLNTLDENNKQNSEVSELKERLELCQRELDELREKYREVDEECEICAEYLRERDAQCLQLKNENKDLQQQVSDLNDRLLNASVLRNQKDARRSFVNAAVNTDEDWANLHSVVVDRMSFDREVDKNKMLQRSVDELRFKNGELKATLAKLQKTAERAAKNKANIRELEATKLELHTCKQELEECRKRCKELDEECETCGEYLRERDEQVRRLMEARDALEARLEELLEKEANNKVLSVRKKRQSMHDQNRNSTIEQSDAATQTNEDLLSYQVERDNNSMLHTNEVQQLKMAVERLSQQKAGLELQLRSVTAMPGLPPVYVATGSAIVQNQHLTDVMKENQKLKKMNAKLITICKKRGKPLGESNRENDDPAEMG